MAAVMMKRLALSVQPLLLAACAHSPLPAANVIEIARPIVLVSDTVGNDIAAYAIFTNRGAETSIVSASCDCADNVELHVVDRSASSPGMISSFPLVLPAGQAVAIEPPGIPRHMMLIGIRQKISEGDVVTMRFLLADGRVVEEAFTAVPSSAAAWKAFDAK